MVCIQLLEYLRFFFPYCELSRFTPSISRQWVPLVSVISLTCCTDSYEVLHVFSSCYEDGHAF